jgi:hypothetical protein
VNFHGHRSYPLFGRRTGRGGKTGVGPRTAGTSAEAAKAERLGPTGRELERRETPAQEPDRRMSARQEQIPLGRVLRHRPSLARRMQIMVELHAHS